MSAVRDQTHQPQPWSVLATAAIAVAVILLGAMAGVVVDVFHGRQWRTDLLEPDGTQLTIGILVGIPIEVVALVAAARKRGWLAIDYLALKVPRRDEVIVAVACLVLFLIASNLVRAATGWDPMTAYDSGIYRTAKDAGWLLGLSLAVVIVGPIGQEIVFRGFVYRGWALPGRELYAIVAISLIWAFMHVQYDWVGIAQVFVAGLLLGWFRWKSGSTSLAIIMHMLLNLENIIRIAIKVEWPT